jgi:hypothetical protein
VAAKQANKHSARATEFPQSTTPKCEAAFKKIKNFSPVHRIIMIYKLGSVPMQNPPLSPFLLRPFSSKTWVRGSSLVEFCGVSKSSFQSFQIARVDYSLKESKDKLISKEPDYKMFVLLEAYRAPVRVVLSLGYSG